MLSKSGLVSEVHHSDIAVYSEGLTERSPAGVGPSDPCGHARRIRAPLGHPLGEVGESCGTPAEVAGRVGHRAGGHRQSARGQGREEFAGDGGDDVAFGGVVGGEDHQDHAAAGGQFDERGVMAGLAGEAAAKGAWRERTGTCPTCVLEDLLR